MLLHPRYFLLLVTLVFSVDAQDNYVYPKGVDYLSADQITTQIIGNTYVAGILWVEYYVPSNSNNRDSNSISGKIRGKRFGISYSGTWTIKGPLMCWDYEEAGSNYNGCYFTALNDNEVLWYKVDGKKYSSLAGKVILEKGNPEKL